MGSVQSLLTKKLMSINGLFLVHCTCAKKFRLKNLQLCVFIVLKQMWQQYFILLFRNERRIIYCVIMCVFSKNRLHRYLESNIFQRELEFHEGATVS